MKRVGFVLKVKADLVEEYTRRHQEVWPEMLDALRRTGWGNYSLFMAPDGTLFGYVETPAGLKAAQDAMAGQEVNARWQAQMAPFFEALSGALPDQSMAELKEVFHLD